MEDNVVDDDTAMVEGLNLREKDVALNAGGDELNSPTNTFSLRLLWLINMVEGIIATTVVMFLFTAVTTAKAVSYYFLNFYE
ncbi:hypothetical protein Tco_1365616 [Tanacetum coccineum]